jgi:hypothetical protein
MDDFAALRAWDRFLDVQGRSERTRRLYRYTLIRVMADTMHPLLEMDEDMVVDYLADLPPRGHARKDATQALRSFFG